MSTISATTKVGIGSGGEARERPLARLARFLFAVLWRRVNLERHDETGGGRGHLVDGAIERLLIVARGFGGAAQLADELERRGSDLVGGGGRLEVGEGLD